MLRFARVAAAALVGLSLAAPAGAEDLNKSLSDLLKSLTGQSEKAAPNKVPENREQITLSFAPLVKATAPSVVNVYAKSKVAQSPFFNDPFFGRFFGDAMPPRVQSSLGSGVVVDPSGLIVTNNHVIEDAEEVKVALADGREFESRVVLRDQSVDLAVLKIDTPQPLVAIGFGDSDALEVGDLVLAIGNPFGVGQTTTSGIVSALARTPVGINDFGFFIQTDAAINPGNSGGALIDMKGELVGINTAIFSKGGGSIGIGFAIPANMVKAVVDSARTGRDFFERPWIGAGFEVVTAQAAEALGLDRPTGALVSSVDADGPAAAAGLRAGDLVLAVNGVEVPNPDALGYRLATMAVGAKATLVVWRQGKAQDVVVTTARAPEGSDAAMVKIDGSSPFAGAKVAVLSPRLAQKLRLPDNTKGVAIVGLEPRSPAAQFGLAPGDIVRSVNGDEIVDVAGLQKATAQQTRWWRFSIERDGGIINQMLRY
jgi:Do/DeqQ family serine protease